MERLVQYLDDMEDAAYACLLLGERLRRAARSLLAAALVLCVQAIGIVAALHSPPIALGLVSVLAVCALYRSTVSLTPVTSRS